ncbi:helix-turn-helix domain-containing protein [Dokdonia sp.]|uniref:helix-turn-helix domain-containing protein n=1 Tax=Dokdonia sp. TaxID=2024995 RepID=UPI003264CB53
MKWYLIFWCFFSVTIATFGQEENFQIPDSLKGKDYEYLYDRYLENYQDTTAVKLYLNTYLTKAVVANDRISQSIVLNNLAYYADTKEIELDLIHKSLSISNAVDSLYSIVTYNHLGIYYQAEYDYENALQQHLKVLHLSEKYDYEQYEIFSYNNIASLKKYIGKHKEALDMYKKSLILQQKNSPSGYNGIIPITVFLAESFRNNKQHDSASYYYTIIKENAQEKDAYYLNIATLNEGINLYYKNDIEEAEVLLQKVTHQINTSDLSGSKYDILLQFYLGKIQLSSNPEATKNHFLKVDSLLTQTNTVLPEVREVYEFLIKKYKADKNHIEHLAITDKLIRFDSIAFLRKINMTDKLHAEFDTPELIKSKEYLIKLLESKNQTLSVKAFLILALFLISISILILQLRKHRLYKKRFEAIITKLNNQQTNNTTSHTLKTPSKKLDIDSPIVTIILEKLVAFETKNEFLKNNITVTSLAKKLGTNTKYLSKIINTYKEKSFIHYINDLRINYMMRELKTNPTLQRYTILSIGQEAGFNSAKSFSDAFKKTTGISPSYYIKNLQAKKTA